MQQGKASERHETLSGYMDRLITSVSARCMVGADADAHPELIDMFLKFNQDVDKVMGMGALLPRLFNFIPKMMMKKSYNNFQKIFVPIIEKRRSDPNAGQDGYLDFMPFILDVVDDNDRVSGKCILFFVPRDQHHVSHSCKQ